jgi:phage-related protein (TIGR01555 family)
MGNNLKMDGWKNAVSGLGGIYDKSEYISFSGFPVIPDQTLADLWVGGGLGHRLVEIVTSDLLREWITISNDKEGEILNILDDLEAQKKFFDVINWKRLFGGGIIVMGISDGVNIEKPVNETKIKSIDYLKVFDKTEIQIMDDDFEDDPSKKNYGDLNFFTITPRSGRTFKIHTSRCLVFKGIPVPARLDSGNFYYWGCSILNPIWNEVKTLGVGFKSAGKILEEFIISNYKFEGLAEMIAEGNEDKLRARMTAIEMQKSMINAVMLDADGEDYSRDTAGVTGLAEVLDRLMMMVSGVTGIPVTRLFGRSPAGQNATGLSDLRNYYDMIRADQKLTYGKQLQRLVDYINIGIGNKYQNPTIIFNPLEQLSQKEIQECKEIQAKVDKIYLEMGVLDSEEVRISRFENGYSFETSIDGSSPTPDITGELDLTGKE